MTALTRSAGAARIGSRLCAGQHPRTPRPWLFDGPVPLYGPACPGDELVAFLGRRPFCGDSEGSAWSA